MELGMNHLDIAVWIMAISSLADLILDIKGIFI
jgi:hypothetical protein